MRAFFSFAILILLFWACHQGGYSVENICIKGSDTEVNVALSLAERFMEKEPRVSIAVTGGGSGTGIAALLNNKTDIANASRPMKPAEILLAESRGIHPKPIIFGMDALAVIVHEKNPLDSINIFDLGKVFRGEIGSWAVLGGPDVPVSLYGRQSNSGTFLFFREKILHADYAPALKQMNGTAQIVEAIAHDPAGIGYVGIGYLSEAGKMLPEHIKVLRVSRDPDQIAYSPLIAAHIVEGNYPIIRPLYQYINGTPNGQLHDYLMFTIGTEGQSIVKAGGYYPISEEQYLENLRLMDVKMAAK